ncbi:MAG TPA: hypothetical protein VMR86_20175 [Myxococcota bacterium]|nr:hypothetical protein [Myxococcota bacterium]
MQRLETTFPKDHRDSVMQAVLRVRARCRMTASDVYYSDPSTVHTVQYRGTTYQQPWQIRTRLEILVADRDAEAVRDALARSLELELGVETVIASSSVDDALHLPSGRRGENALERGLSGVFTRLARAISSKS